MDTKQANTNIAIANILKTPSRSKRSAQTPRKIRLNDHEDIAWTVVRCNRLLRSIISRIQILRRLSENDFATQYQRTPKAKRKRAASVDPVEKLEPQFAALQTPSRGDDPEWFPTEERKGAAKKYGGRGRPKKGTNAPSKEKKAAGAGFRTPYVKKLLRSDAALSPAEDAYSTSSGVGQMSRKRWTYEIQPNTHTERALKTLLDAFGTLLEATEPEGAGPDKPPSRKGAPSLSSMCLRRVPQYIDYEQEWAEEEEGDYGFDATDVVYHELEELGSGSWAGLREVIRAHAVKLITDAIEVRMWGLESLEDLVDICKKHRAVRECQKVLKSWLVSSKGKVEDGLETFVENCIRLDYRGFMFQTIEQLLRCGDLDWEEALHVDDLWRDLPNSLARESTRAAVCGLLVAFSVAMSAVEISREEVTMKEANYVEARKKLEHVITIMTAMGMVNDFHEHFPKDEARISALLHRAAIDGAIEMRHTRSTRGVYTMHQLADPFLAGSLLVLAHQLYSNGFRSASPLSMDGFAALLALSPPTTCCTHTYKIVSATEYKAEFMCTVISILETAEQWHGRSMITLVASNLLEMSSKISDIQGRSSIRTLAVEISRYWAEDKGDYESHAFADEVQRKALETSKRELDNDCLASLDSNNGYRWEEGIAEWVAKTPVCQSRQTSVLSRDSGIGSSEPEIPSKELCKGQSKKYSRRRSPSKTKAQASSRTTNEVAHCLGDVPVSRRSALSSNATRKGRRVRTTSKPPANAQSTVAACFSSMSENQATVVAHDSGHNLVATACADKQPARRGRPPKHKKPEERDELSISPVKPTSSEPLAEEVERDELANTPAVTRLPQTPAPKKTGARAVKKQRTKATQPTPVARMTLRSQRQPLGEIRNPPATRGGHEDNDDELCL